MTFSIDEFERIRREFDGAPLGERVENIIARVQAQRPGGCVIMLHEEALALVRELLQLRANVVYCEPRHNK